MITNSFETKTEPLLTPKAFYGDNEKVCDVCVFTFSTAIFNEVMTKFDCTPVAKIKMLTGDVQVYTFEYKGKKIAFYLTGMGATLCATYLLDCNCLIGTTKYVMFGSAGSLNSEKTEGKYVIPTESYRDEGISYHYMEASDFIEIKQAKKTEKIFKELGLPYVTGRVWTTDALYRETRTEVERHQKEGCLAVDMEVSGVEAVCDYHGFELYNFLVTGDVLDEATYSLAGLQSANHDVDKLYIALELAIRI